MDSYIKIERIPYEEPHHVQLAWDISNANVSACFEYYDNANSISEIAERLEEFPRHNDDVFLYEIGSERSEDNFAYYFRLRVFTTNHFGRAAIQVRFCNNRELPEREIMEFCIQTEAAAINRLGKLFREFAKLKKEYLVWTDSDVFIGNKNEYVS